MISKKVEEKINSQINYELFSAYLYQAMSAFFESINLKGFANWTAVQAKEEMTHAMKFYNYLNDRGGRVIFSAIDAPKNSWDNIVEVVEDILEHEQKVTARINELANVALEEKDHATSNELQWFIKEQVEEEANVSELLDELKLLDGKGAGLFMLDRELKQRVFVDETANV